MSDKIQFTPVRGTEANIMTMSRQNGYVYFATDTGRIYIDTATENKKAIGGNGVSLFYANGTATQDPLIDEQFTLVLSSITDY
jgi:hypothetical protein